MVDCSLGKYEDTIAVELLSSEEHNDSLPTSSCSTVTLHNFSVEDGRRKSELVSIPCGSRTEAEHLVAKIRNAIKRPTPPHLPSAKNRVFLLSNPFSGQKKSLTLWDQHGRTVLATAGIQVDQQITEYPGHAREIVQRLDIDQYDALLVNSGDGLVSEVIDGLLSREDRSKALNFPIAHIPGGTSNALAASICFACNEPFSSRDVFITECALMVAIPRYIPLQLYKVDTEHDGSRTMFMSANWGLIADIGLFQISHPQRLGKIMGVDIGSERFRWAGMARLHIEAIIRILRLPAVARYKARISYVPVSCPETSRKAVLTHETDRKLFGKDHFQQVTSPNNDIEIPPLTEKLDEAKWTTIEGEYIMVNVTAISHLGSDLPFLPSARMNDQVLYLTLIDWAVVKSRAHIADLFVRMNRGIHLSYPCFQVIPVHGVRVEPITKNGYFAIDGEPCTNGSAFQVRSTGLHATVVGRPTRE